MSDKSKSSGLFEYLSIVLFLGIVGGVMVGLEKSWFIFRKPLLPVVMDIVRANVNLVVAVIAVLVIVYFGFMFLFRQKGKNALLSFAAAGVIILPLFLYLGVRINQIHLPGLLTTASLVGNFIMGVGFLVFWYVAFRMVNPWVRARILGESKKRLMNNPFVFGSLFAIILILNLYPLFDRTSNEEAPQNVIVILIDALRADHLGCYGYHRPTSPNIDAFAKEAVVFEQAISQSSFTKTSIASLFTGKYPYRHHVYWGNRADSENRITSDILSQNEETLAEAMLSGGYITGAWVHNVHLNSYMGFGQGFTTYKDKGGSIEWMSREFLQWMNDYGPDYKTFSYVHYLDLHDPYKPEAPYDTLYGTYSNIYSDIDLDEWGAYLHKIREKEITLEQKEVEQLIAYYDGLINYVDAEIGKLFAELKSLGVYDESLIIITADHGDAFMEHEFISHSATPYDELLRVPLIVKFPNSQYGGQVIEQQVRLVDVKPTLAGLAGIEIKEADGFNLMSLVKGHSTNGSKAHFPKFAVSEIATKGGYPIVSVRTNDFKYIHFENKMDEFYNLKTDPLEQINLISTENGISKEFESMALDVVKARSVNDTREKVEIDEETIKKLKALGYLK